MNHNFIIQSTVPPSCRNIIDYNYKRVTAEIRFLNHNLNYWSGKIHKRYERYHRTSNPDKKLKIHRKIAIARIRVLRIEEAIEKAKARLAILSL